MTQIKNFASYKAIFAISIPMILSAVSVPMLGVVDTAILGHLSSAKYLAAINIGTTVFNVLFWGFGFLKMSTTGLIAQSYGLSDQLKINQQLFQALFLAMVLAFCLMLFHQWIGPFAVSMASEGGEVATMALQYFSIRIFSSPATLAIYVLLGYFLAIQRAKVVLYIMLVNQLGNMILDYVFVMKFHWHVQGVAYGSLISEYLALMVAIYHLNGSGFSLPEKLNKCLRFNDEIRALFSLNRDIFIRTLCLMAVFTLMTKGSAKLGELPLAANAVLLNFFYIMSYALDGFAHAIESLGGQAYGAKNSMRLKQLVRDVFIISLFVALCFCLLYWFYGVKLIHSLTSLDSVRIYAEVYLPWLIILPVIAMPSFVYDGLFVATTEAKIMRNSMVIATFFCYIPLWYAFGTSNNHGLWLAFLCFFVIRSLLIHFYYRNWFKLWEKSLHIITNKN